MSESYTFRSALNGFNRSDVVNCIESLSAEHKKTISALEHQRDQLTEETGRLSSRIGELEAQLLQNQQERDRLSEESERLLSRINELETQLLESRQEHDAPSNSQELSPGGEAVEAEAPAPDELELAAYRRAEQAERNAVVRAKRIYAQLDTLFSEIRGRCLDTCGQMDGLGRSLAEDLAQMQDAADRLKGLFDETKTKLGSIDLPEITEDT